ncbi:MAG: hypothetical protein ACP5KN_15445 [Armatimonadota bacterium]
MHRADDLQVTMIDEGRVRLRGREVALGEDVDDLTLRAILDGRIAVLETEEGELLYASESGLELGLRPWLEAGNVEGFEAARFDELMEAQEDLLGREALAAGEPEYSTVAAMLPRLVGDSFVGDPGRDERFIIRPDGSVEGLLEPLVELAPEELARSANWGIIDRQLPLPVLRVQMPEGRTREQIAVGSIDAEGRACLLVRRREVGPGGSRIEHLALPSESPAQPRDFYAALLAIWRAAQRFREACARVTGGDRLLGDLAISSLWLADLTARGCHPRYGIGYYDEERHHGFPPNVLYPGLALLEWGHFQRAADLIGCYLDAHVADDGTFVYYGPAVAEYGQFLSLCARYVDLTGDLRWWRRRESRLRRVWERLLVLRAQSLDDEQAPHHARGLIPGLPEADYHGSEEQWREYYYSGDAWAIRGLSDVARILRRAGRAREAASISDSASAYRRDLLSSIAACSTVVGEEIYVPPGPAQREPIQRMTGDRHASYCNYRYLAEMVSAGVLEPETVRQVIDWRRGHGGELLAMTRFQDHLDDWPVTNWARAMLEVGDVAHFQLLLYAHLIHHQAAGWLAAPEQANIAPDDSGLRSYYADQVVPCQVTPALMLRWALLYELRDEDTLLVAPAIPHHWIAHGGLTAIGLPTRWGPVDLSVEDRSGRVETRLGLPEAFYGQVRVRVPAPPGALAERIVVEGAAEAQAEPGAAVVRVSGGGELTVSAELRGE